MSEKCITAFENGNLYEIEKLYQEVIYFFHTFGLRPECNRYFWQDIKPAKNWRSEEIRPLFSGNVGDFW